MMDQPSAEEWRRRAATDRAGYGTHSSICTCQACQATYVVHNAGYEPCVCFACEMHNLNNNLTYRSDGKGQTIVATVNFCDRCESMGKSRVMGSISYRTDATKGEKILEVCPGCVDDFMTWLKEDIMTGRERGYKEPWKENTEPSKQGVVLDKNTLKDLLKALESGERNGESDET